MIDSVVYFLKIVASLIWIYWTLFDWCIAVDLAAVVPIAVTDVVVAIGDVLAIAMSNVEAIYVVSNADVVAIAVVLSIAMDDYVAIYVVINAGVVAIVVVELLEFLKCGLWNW